ncbi:MAG: hypothetical protein KDK99_13760, partial [Verrucomicrobiales bacterium]|nr:hypothetical protein [Verrucomicrobiales bacterium]
MRPFCSSLLLLFMVSMTTNLRSQQIEAVPPTPATEVADSFRTLDGFQMTVIAAEPLVTDPVALCYDAKGRLYVAEMNDYPYTDKATHKPMQENPTDRPIGKIRRLEDTDGDGRFDSATVFAESLSWPTGIAAWKDGIFVTAAPDLWYLKDTDGDGKADVRERILTGYRKYNVQAEVNNPIWGLDHQLYIASASNGGRIYVPAAGSGSAVDLGRNDIRIDPNDLSKFEKITGGIQFGNTFDDWGNRFLCNNSLPLVHAVFPMSALDRNPWLPTRRAVENCPDPNEPIQLFPTTSIEGWRLQRYKDREHVPRKGYRPPRGLKPGDPSSPTSSSAPIVYRGDAYPERHRGTVFVAEPCYNLVYRLKLEPVGPTFIARKPASDNASDMVTSRDVWFRPICFANAPDGCLHIADFYRESIEHPWSLPEDFHARMDLERGKDRGRIYRLEPPGFQPRAAPHLDELSSQDLVPLLAHPNAWHRETAHRLLFERQDSTVANAVRGLLSKSEAPLGRLHALWTLHGLGLLQENDVAASLRDAASGVRVNAVRLACLKAREWPALLETLANCAADPDAAVRFEV